MKNKNKNEKNELLTSVILPVNLLSLITGSRTAQADKFGQSIGKWQWGQRTTTFKYKEYFIIRLKFLQKFQKAS